MGLAISIKMLSLTLYASFLIYTSALFREACGILVYKSQKNLPRKTSSANSLTLSHVNKITDIIGHVTSFLSPVSLAFVVMHLLHVLYT